MKNRLIKRQLILRGALIGLIITIVFSGISLFLLQRVVGSLANVMVPATDVIQKSNLKNYIGLPLPDEATDFHGISYSFLQSRILNFKFQSSPKVLDSFLRELGLKDSLKEGFNPLPRSNSPQNTGSDWWNSKDSVHFAGASWVKSGTFYDVLVDTTDTESYMVYLAIEQT